MSDAMIDLRESPEDWSRVELGSICEVSGGFAAPKGEEAFKNGSVPFVRMQDLGRYHRTTSLIQTKDRLNPDFIHKHGLRLVPKGSILIPRSGSVSLNHRAILGIDACIVSHICALTPILGNVDPDYLYWALCNFDMRNIMRKTTGLDAITFEDVKHVRVPLPPLDIQRMIALTLERADNLRRSRERVAQLMDNVTPSVFLKMFGDPTSNPKAWEVRSLGEVTLELRYGTSVKCSPLRNGGIPVLRIPNVLRGSIDLGDLKFANLGETELARLSLLDGDLLFVRTNGNRDYVGRCAVFHSASKSFAFASYLIRARLEESAIRPDFARVLLSFPELRSQLFARSRTSAGQYNINIEGLKSIRLILPPIELQDRFIASMNGIDKLRNTQMESTFEVNQLFQSIMRRAFRGDLRLSTVFHDTRS